MLLWGALAAAAIAAPLFAAQFNSFLTGTMYLLFSPVCHQIPERSFRLLGHPWAACHRCSGIYLGLFAATLFRSPVPLVLAPSARRRAWVALATLPLVIDAMLPSTGIWTNTASSRFVTGFAFGAMLSSLIVPGVSELLTQSLRRGPRALAQDSHGDRT